MSSRLEFVAGGLPDVLLLLAALIGWAGAARAVLAITVVDLNQKAVGRCAVLSSRLPHSLSLGPLGVGRLVLARFKG